MRLAQLDGIQQHAIVSEEERHLQQQRKTTAVHVHAFFFHDGHLLGLHVGAFGIVDLQVGVLLLDRRRALGWMRIIFSDDFIVQMRVGSRTRLKMTVMMMMAHPQLFDARAHHVVQGAQSQIERLGDDAPPAVLDKRCERLAGRLAIGADRMNGVEDAVSLGPA